MDPDLKVLAVFLILLPAASRKVDPMLSQSPSDTCFTATLESMQGSFAGIWGHGESIKHGEKRRLDPKQWYQKMDLPRITHVHWDGEIMISFWFGLGIRSPVALFSRFQNMGAETYNNRQQVKKGTPPKCWPPNLFEKKQMPKKCHFPQEKGHQSLGPPLALRASLLASVGLSSVSVAGPSGGCGAGACGVPGSGAIGLAGSVPSRGIWASCFRDSFWWGFWGELGVTELHLNQNVLQNSGNFWEIPSQKKE